MSIQSTPISRDQIRVPLLREQVSDLLRQAIVEMRLQPGQRLVERELIEWTGVSRSTIREALRQLTAEGLVKTIPQRGAVVADLSVSEATELYEIRALLEGLAGRQFVERASEKQHLLLREAFGQIDEVAKASGDIWALLQAKGRFYDILFQGAANDTIREVLEGLQARITVLRATSLSQHGRVDATMLELQAILDAVNAHDANAAERSCAAHVRAAGNCALIALSQAMTTNLEAT